MSFSLHANASRQVSYERAHEIAVEAFRVWQEADCGDGRHPSIRVDDVFGPAVCLPHEYNLGAGNANVISFYDDGTWPHSPSALALTSVIFRVETGEILDADMEINGSMLFSTGDELQSGAYDLLSVVTHETGHFLGIDHTPVPNATMTASYGTGQDHLRTLEADDVAAICDAYPPDRKAEACDYTPRHGFSPDCAMLPSYAQACSLVSGGVGSPSHWGAWLVGLLLCGVGRRASRRVLTPGRRGMFSMAAAG